MIKFTKSKLDAGPGLLEVVNDPTVERARRPFYGLLFLVVTGLSLIGAAGGGNGGAHALEYASLLSPLADDGCRPMPVVAMAVPVRPGYAAGTQQSPAAESAPTTTMTPCTAPTPRCSASFFFFFFPEKR